MNADGRGSASDLRPRVLCVDDEPNVLQGLTLQLGRRWRVLTALNGAEALEILRAEPRIAVVISDLRMPSMDGSALLHEAGILAPHATRILLTGHADIRSAIAAVNEGQIFRFLEKPCAPGDLLAAVAEAEGRHRLAVAERLLMEQAAATKIRDPLAELARIFERSCELFGCRYAAMSARLGRQPPVL
ncbi:MAG: response regulator, partial [Gammaproteobacteria bacterium]